MGALASVVAALLEAGYLVLRRLDAARAAALRNRIAADGAGSLLGKLNPAGKADAIYARTVKCPDSES